MEQDHVTKIGRMKGFLKENYNAAVLMGVASGGLFYVRHGLEQGESNAIERSLIAAAAGVAMSYAFYAMNSTIKYVLKI